MRGEAKACRAGRYDTGVIAGALPYLRDTLLSGYEGDVARCGPV